LTDGDRLVTISIAAELVGMHPQTLRIYEQKGPGIRSARRATRASTRT
jgi:DNA-binding transcriptional MerR regulator